MLGVNEAENTCAAQFNSACYQETCDVCFPLCSILVQLLDPLVQFQHEARIRPSCSRGQPGYELFAQWWPAKSIVFGPNSAPFSSCRGPQAALKCSCRSDRVTRDGPAALRVRAAQSGARKDCALETGLDIPQLDLLVELDLNPAAQEARGRPDGRGAHARPACGTARAQY